MKVSKLIELLKKYENYEAVVEVTVDYDQVEFLPVEKILLTSDNKLIIDSGYFL